MSKLKLEDLRYLVLEGGGARGAAYLGALRGLEEAFHKASDPETNNDQFIRLSKTQSETSSILNYSINENGSTTTRIKGVAGSSAGAITTYAVALGLNSKQIETVMKFQFSEFLSESQLSVGKYRMIDKDSNLKIGMDAEKQVGFKSEKFEYDLSKDQTTVSKSIGKFLLRQLITNLIVKIILDGIISNIEAIVKAVYRGRGINIPVNRMNDLAKQLAVSYSSPAVIPAISDIVGTIKGEKSPIPLSGDSIMNLICDRGMFSGFIVREFFFDLTLFALVNDTHFQRSILNSKQNKLWGITKDDLDAFTNFEIGKRSKTFGDPTTFITLPSLDKPRFERVKKAINFIQHLNFEEFYTLTGINFGVCVSNFTTDLPVYFSKDWTPHFYVLEAVAASMTIPPAIKPLFNEADVFFTEGTPNSSSNSSSSSSSSFTAKTRKTHSKNIAVSIRENTNNGVKIYQHQFINGQGDFRQSDYYYYEFLVKKALQKILQKNGKHISSNVSLDLNTYLPVLRNLVIGKFIEEPKQTTLINETYKIEVESDGKTFTIDYALFAFFYNSRFKGMLVDGGYRNNIPYNFFREDGKELTQLLALKLDGEFPPELLRKLHESIQEFKSDRASIESALKDSEDKLSKQGERIKERIANELKNTKEGTPELNKRKLLFLIRKTELIFSQYLKEKYPNKNDSKKEKAIDELAIKRLMKSVLKAYRKTDLHKPWAVKKKILATATNGFAYGTELGQIKQMSDNNFIIPLYDCGVGTYDFDMNKVRPMIDLAQRTAKASIEEYFEK